MMSEIRPIDPSIRFRQFGTWKIGCPRYLADCYTIGSIVSMVPGVANSAVAVYGCLRVAHPLPTRSPPRASDGQESGPHCSDWYSQFPLSSWMKKQWTFGMQQPTLTYSNHLTFSQMIQKHWFGALNFFHLAVASSLLWYWALSLWRHDSVLWHSTDWKVTRETIELSTYISTGQRCSYWTCSKDSPSMTELQSV